MKKRLIFGCVGVLALSFSGVAVQADELPGRRSGLWTSVTSGEGMPQVPVKECVDQAKDKENLAHPKQQPGTTCDMRPPVRTKGGFEVQGTCTMGSTKMAIKSSTTGDFNTKLDTVMTTAFDPPLFGRKESTMKIVSTYLGACPADLKPGQFTTGNGRAFTQDEAMEMAQSAQKMLNSKDVQRALQQAMQAQGGR